MIIISKKTTHEEYIDKVYGLHPNIIVLDEYASAHDKMQFMCTNDWYMWEAESSSIYKSGCPMCSGKARYNAEEFECKIKGINPNITLISDYVNSHTKVSYKCNIDGMEWSALPGHLMDGVGCPKCGGVATRTPGQYSSELRTSNRDVEVIGEYCGNKTKIKHKCTICGNVWSASPNLILRGSGCPVCKKSKGERRIMKYLDSIGLKYCSEKKFKDCIDKYPLPFDFYIESMNTAIEYDGHQHFYPVKFAGLNDKNSLVRFDKTKKHDERKTNYCRDKGIKLIRIPYTEFDNIENILDKQLL